MSQSERKYIPSEEMGDYEEYKKKRTNKKKGPLFPLDEEGSYGAPPSALPPPLPGYQKRERKPKVYASYAVSSDCCMHADKLEQNERDRGQTPPRSYRKRSSTPSFSRSRGSSQPRTRSNSFRLPSPAPSIDAYSDRSNWKNSLRSSESPARSFRGSSTPRTASQKVIEPSQHRREEQEYEEERIKDKQGRRSQSSDGMSTRSSYSSTDWGYTSYENFSAGQNGSSISTRNTKNEMKQRSYSTASHYDESLESAYRSNYKTPSSGALSLSSLKTPEISSWDNLGILGLSSKMFSDTSSIKEKVYSNSSILRKESVTSYAM